MKTRTKLILLGLTVTTGILLSGVSRVSAQSPSPTLFTQQFNTMVDKIAQKLGLTSTQVKAVIEETRNEKQIERQALFEERLTLAVGEGVITETQKQDILSKFKEHQAKRVEQFDELKNLTLAERHTLRETEAAELETWAKEKGISMIVLRGLGIGFGGHGKMMMGMGRGGHFLEH